MTRKTDKITDYREQYGGGTLPLSHTVASRELVYQVPLRISNFADSLFRGNAPNTPFEKGMVL